MVWPVAGCSMMNNNPETETGVQPEGQKSKTASHWLLPLHQFEMVILPSGISEQDCVRAVPSRLLFLSSAGIKGVLHYHLVSIAN